MTVPVAPDDPRLADAAAHLFAAYVHIPFCARVCPYCDFAVVAGAEHMADRYVEAVVAEIGRTPVDGRPLAAVHVGGGTPSRLPAAALAEIVEALAGRFGLAPGAEVGLEANPEDWTDALAEELAAAGFTRVSFGAQSFDPGVLAALGRAHRPAQAEAAVAAARRAGFATVNIDLIFGTPGESPASWTGTLARALALAPEHLSTYALTVERGTPLSRAVRAGAPGPDPDDQADKYQAAVAAAAAAGLARYEVSNFARPGHASVYNLVVWAGGDYAGFGCGAHAHAGGVRRRNLRRLDAYLAAVERGGEPVAGTEVLEPREQVRERLFLGLRRAAGAAASDAGAALLAAPAGRRLVATGLLMAEGGRLRVSDPLLTDEVSRAVLALEGFDC